MRKITSLSSIRFRTFLFATAAVFGMAAIRDADAAHDFTLEAPAGGKTFRLEEARGKFVALHFLLKTECPFCLRHTAEFTRKAPTVAGVAHLFIKPDSPEEIRKWANKIGGDAIPAPPIYHDPGATLAKHFGVPDGYRFHGEAVHYPALILLGPDGKEVFRHVGKNNTDRLPFDAFAAKVAEVSRTPAVTHYNLGSDRLALKGYDVVAYFESGQPAKGNPSLQSTWRGVHYHFSSEANRARFADNPERYLPAYGGWCATAMAKGKKVEIDPANFKVTDGRLFLFYTGLFANALDDWKKDERALTAKANGQWQKLSGE